MFIQNCSLDDIRKGSHTDAGENSMLIQIVDPDTDFPTPARKFKEVYKFKFLDIEKEDHPEACRDEDAMKIFRLLRHAKENGMNVIVHCHMGLCRSGAVAETGIAIGWFEDTGKIRFPNLLIKGKLFKYLNQWLDKNENNKKR